MKNIHRTLKFSIATLDGSKWNGVIDNKVLKCLALKDSCLYIEPLLHQSDVIENSIQKQRMKNNMLCMNSVIKKKLK